MSLSEEQLKFLEECNLEFSDRFTDAEQDYQKAFEEGIPPPPIICPWYPQSRYNRDRAGRSRHQDFGNRNNRNWDSGHPDRSRYNRYERRDRRPY